MMRSKFSWRLAALCAIGWAAAGMTAWAQEAAKGPSSRATHLMAETGAGAAAASPTTAISSLAPAKVASTAASPVAKPPVSPAATQRTVYQQSHGTLGDAPPEPTSRALSQYETANRAYVAEPLTPVLAPESIGVGAGGNCGAGCAAGGNCGAACGCLECCDPYFYNQGWFVGADFLYLRPNFSSPVAAVEQSTVIDPNTNASVLTNRVLEYDIDYDASFRIFGGYRWGECGEALELSYWRIDTGEDFVSPPATASLFFLGFEQVTADGPGEILRSEFDMELDVFDVDYSKRIPVRKGAPSGCGNCCPPWDWGWSLGARFADFERNHNNSVVNAAGALIASARIDTIFRGAGPRVGFEGRRYLGEQGRWSLYGTSHFALLLGDYEVSSSRVAGLTTTNRTQEFIRTAPVADIEVGMSRQIGCRTLLSAGYQFQAWWEIGSFDAILIGDCECVTSSNVLSFDGLFVRLEHTFGPHCKRRCP